MTTPQDPHHEKESVIIYDMSPELEEELKRRARETGTDPAAEAARILERHAEDEAG